MESPETLQLCELGLCPLTAASLGALPGWAVRAWRSCQVMGPSLGLGRGPSGHRLPQRAWKEPK